MHSAARSGTKTPGKRFHSCTDMHEREHSHPHHGKIAGPERRGGKSRERVRERAGEGNRRKGRKGGRKESGREAEENRGGWREPERLEESRGGWKRAGEGRRAQWGELRHIRSENARFCSNWALSRPIRHAQTRLETPRHTQACSNTARHTQANPRHPRHPRHLRRPRHLSRAWAPQGTFSPLWGASGKVLKKLWKILEKNVIKWKMFTTFVPCSVKVRSRERKKRLRRAAPKGAVRLNYKTSYGQILRKSKRKSGRQGTHRVPCRLQGRA